MLHPPGLITLLTDFGDRDSFVASMKGVILTINPQARIVDLSHHIAPHAVGEAAYFLKSCYRDFPVGTVHVAVVDPGVGSRRRPIIMRSERYFFLAPDNGLLTPILAEGGEMDVRQIENEDYRLTSLGDTFDGRDVFAPAAAWLTKRRSFVSFGQPILDLVRLSVDAPTWQGSILVGTVVSIDRFGNLISNITTNLFEEVQAKKGEKILSIRVGARPIDGFVRTYSEGSMTKPYALINSHGQLEVFLREKSAKEAFAIMVGEPISIA